MGREGGGRKGEREDTCEAETVERKSNEVTVGELVSPSRKVKVKDDFISAECYFESKLSFDCYLYYNPNTQQPS